MKKTVILFILLFSSVFAFAGVDYELGLGSGYVFYGDDELSDALDSFDQSGQIILCGNFGFSFPLAEPVDFVMGADSIIDGRWKGSNHVFLWDYAAVAGFDVYPGFGGLSCSVQYCFGRRTDFMSLTDDEHINSTKWGNGFAFGIGYDFCYGRKGMAPVVSASWRHMPRGNSCSDDILELKLKIKTHK